MMFHGRTALTGRRLRVARREVFEIGVPQFVDPSLWNDDRQELTTKAPPAGFEPATCGLEVRCSIQLSYRGKRLFFTVYCDVSEMLFFFDTRTDARYPDSIEK
jgi:hypothetical protein